MTIQQSNPNFEIEPDQAWWILPKSLFDGVSLHTDMAVQIVNDKIVSLSQKSNIPESTQVWQTSFHICPGFFDIQVNGGGGVMFNNAPTVATLETIYNAHLQFGTTSWLPTFITDKAAPMRQAVNAVIEANGRFGVAGIHLEGPYINIKRKGTHKESYIRQIEPLIFEMVKRLADNDIPTLITLAPECVPEGTIEKLVALGAKVSAGHTAATADQTKQALEEGLSCFTHLYNAMPPMTSREPNIVGEALNSEAYCGIIADLHHVSAQMLGIAIRSRKISNRMIVVTDAMSTIGGPEYFELYGEIIEVTDGRLVNQSGSLAGAHIDMISSVKNLVNDVRVDAETALAMATYNPANLMELERNIGRITANSNADLLLLDDELNLRNVIASGLAINNSA